MGDSEPPPSPWVGREGDLAHPAAPAGGGGDGNFKRAGALGGDGNDSDPVRHPQSPSARVDGLTAPETVELDTPGVKVTEVKRNPPPATSAGKVHTITIKGTDVKIEVEVLSDKSSTGNSGGIKTLLDPTAVKPTYPVAVLADDKTKPDGTPIPRAVPEIVKGLQGKYTIAATVTIQVIYGAGTKATDGAAWGRGTTEADATKLDTTTGFHESCHMADFVAYLKTAPFPNFTGKVGDTEDAFNAKKTACDTAIETYFATCETQSRTKTDQVGTTMDDYVSKHSGVSGH